MKGNVSVRAGDTHDEGGAPINPEMWGEEEDGLAWGETTPLGQLVLPGYNKSNDHSSLKQDILVSVYTSSLFVFLFKQFKQYEKLMIIKHLTMNYHVIKEFFMAIDLLLVTTVFEILLEICQITKCTNFFAGYVVFSPIGQLL